MESTLNKPIMTPLETGDSFKTFEITAKAGMEMPNHHSTKEAVVTVQSGRAILKMPSENHVLNAGSSFIIPAGIEHTLSVEQDFRAIAVMALESEIEFN